MSDYFDRVEGHLLDAAERHARRGSARWLSLRAVRSAGRGMAILNASTVLAAVLVVASLAVAAVFLTSVHPARQPPRGPLSNGQGCGAAGAQRLSRGSPPKSLLSILAVLRRPQTPQDRLPAREVPPGWRSGSTRKLLRLGVRRHDGRPPSLETTNTTVYEYSKYVRRARGFAGGGVYLIPLAAAADSTGSGRCNHPYFAGIALYQLRHGAGSGGCCFDASQILALDASSSGSTLTSIVPDRVGSVTLYFKAQSTPATSPPSSIPHAAPGTPATITTEAVGNVITVVPPPGIGSYYTVRPVWRSTTGQIIKPPVR